MKKVTSQDVAKLAGVSQASVSLILNNSDKVTFSSETKEQVFAAAKELGYKLPRRTRPGDQKKNRQLLILTPTLTNYYYTELLQCAQDYARQCGYRVIVCNTFRDSETERYYLEHFTGMDGILYTFLTSFPQMVEQIAETTPVVLIGEKRDNLNICSIELSNRMAGTMVAEHLYELGHRRFIFVSTPLNRLSLSREQRLQGMRSVFEKKGLEDPITVLAPAGDIEREKPGTGVSFEYEVGHRLTLEALQNGTDATAFIGVNDMTALGAMNAIEQHGLRIPQDISVCGFDNIFPVTVVTPALTTVDHQLRERCKSAIDMVISLRNSATEPAPLVNKIEYAPLLIVRNSTGQAPTVVG